MPWLQVVFDEAVVKPEELVGAVEDAGFDGSLLSVRRAKQQLEVRALPKA